MKITLRTLAQRTGAVDERMSLLEDRVSELEQEFMNSLYEMDFAVWAEMTAAQIRSGQWVELDRENAAEEIESLGRSQRSELASRLMVLIAHLLKRTVQRTTVSWEVTMLTQRNAIEEVLESSPSLRPTLPALVEKVYPKAVKLACIETQLTRDKFESRCPFKISTILNDEE